MRKRYETLRDRTFSAEFHAMDCYSVRHAYGMQALSLIHRPLLGTYCTQTGSKHAI